jgi:tRNA modification GTPase
VIALWGNGAEGIVDLLFRPVHGRKDKIPSYGRAAYGFLEHEGDLLDEVLILNVAKDRPGFEICCHGGSASAHAILKALSARGARLCPWSHLIRQRSLKHDLLKDLLESRANDPAALLAHLYSGSLHRAFSFLDEVLDTVESEENRERVNAARELAKGLEESYERGRFLHRTPKVVLMGPANAGKSTLFNAVLGEQRALTSKVPGTTRDPVEATFLLQGFPVRIYDLPGEGIVASSSLDREVRRNARLVMEDADLLVTVHACHKGFTPKVPELKKKTNRKRVLVYNKADLADREAIEGMIHASRPEPEVEYVAISALKGQGISSFIEKVGRALGLWDLAQAFSPMIFNKRQLALVRKAGACLHRRSYDAALKKRLKAYIAE